MNVLHINHSDIGGGAAIGAYRVHKGLIQIGVDSRLLVRESQLGEAETTVLASAWYDKELVKWGKRLGFKCIAPLSPMRVLDMPLYRDSDIVHVHNLHSGFFNLRFLPRCAKPIVWTIHDMWPITGDCIYSNSCPCWDDSEQSAYRGRCVDDCQCKRDHARRADKERRIKKEIYRRSDITVICTSKWLEERVRKSILGSKPIHRIPYGIDTQAYIPLDRDRCREILRLPRGKKLLLNVAESLGDPRKGVDLLAEALCLLPQSLKDEAALITMGRIAGSPLASLPGIETVHMGYVGSDALKAAVYSAADAFLMPTRADTFGIVIQESMACGVPVVAFSAGGVTDPVRHGDTGLLALPENAADFAQKIVDMLENDDDRSRMGARAREVCLQEYDHVSVAEQYARVYKALLDRARE